LVGVLQNNWDIITWERQAFSILIDSNNDQSNAAFNLYNDIMKSAYPLKPVVKFQLDGGDSWINSGNVGIGTTSPNSKLQVVDGYIQLDVSSGLPPSADCDDIDEIGRMKVDNTEPYMYVCMEQGWIIK